MLPTGRMPGRRFTFLARNPLATETRYIRGSETCMTKPLCFVLSIIASAQNAPLAIGSFRQHVAARYTSAEGLPSDDVANIGIAANGDVVAVTSRGGAVFRAGRWTPASAAISVRKPADFLRDDRGERVFPRDGNKSWAPVDVHSSGTWFASPQGVGKREAQGWKLYGIEEGLPLDEFTGIAAARDGSVWLATPRGAIRFDGKTWEYRQGLRWLPDDNIRAVAVDAEDNAWFATAKGVGVIRNRPMTLAEKARFFEEEIDRRHRRTPYEYVLEVSVAAPGDAANFIQRDSDNDGLWTSMYGAGECFAYAATKDPKAKARAKKAFDAMRFLGSVTQGGTPPAPRGYVARTVLPTSGPDPNASAYTPEADRKMQSTRDSLWKVMNPRWPRSADGKWFWKADTSSDELDGHYFLYGLYYDLVAKGDAAEERSVKDHVAALTDHLIAHNFQLVDHDGTVTRWGVYNPEKLNHDSMWADDRSLNSSSMLSYLKTAEHITGDAKYAAAAKKLIAEHGYHINTMMAKSNGGAGAGNQSDDEMAFMLLYNLMRYETDPKLRMIYGITLKRRWDVEAPELNPLFNFIAASVLQNEKYTDSHRTHDLTPRGAWLEESADTLKRFPLDRFDWRHTNSHRKDIVKFPGSNRGHRRDGRVVPIDERFVNHWNHDPWALDQGGAGRALASGAAFLLPYYMGLYHGFLKD